MRALRIFSPGSRSRAEAPRSRPGSRFFLAAGALALAACQGTHSSGQVEYGEEVLDPNAHVQQMAAALERVVELELPPSLDPGARPADLPFDVAAVERTRAEWSQRLASLQENASGLHETLLAIDEAALAIFNLGQTVRHEDVPESFSEPFVREIYLRPVKQYAEQAYVRTVRVHADYEAGPDRFRIGSDQFRADIAAGRVIQNGDVELFLAALDEATELTTLFGSSFEALVYGPVLEAVEEVRGIGDETPDFQIALHLGATRELVKGALLELDQLRGKRYFWRETGQKTETF